MAKWTMSESAAKRIGTRLMQEAKESGAPFYFQQILKALQDDGFAKPVSEVEKLMLHLDSCDVMFKRCAYRIGLAAAAQACSLVREAERVREALETLRIFQEHPE